MLRYKNANLNKQICSAVLLPIVCSRCNCLIFPVFKFLRTSYLCTSSFSDVLVIRGIDVLKNQCRCP